MKIAEKIKMDYEGLMENGPITIVAFGDSVTHGKLRDWEFDYEMIYLNQLRKKILEVRNYVPVNVINAGISGATAAGSLARMDSQVLKHEPDLIIICFGLNDVNGDLEEYLNAMRIIFKKAKASGSDVIFMTPNMMNTYVAEDTWPDEVGYATLTAQMQNEGKLDQYIENAIMVAEEEEIPVCDCYNIWKEMSKERDITMLLANRINHPIPEMHKLFAEKIFEMIFK